MSNGNPNAPGGANLQFITDPVLPPAEKFVPYAVDLLVTGGNPPYTFSVGGGAASFPAGLSLDPQTGTIAGIPTARDLKTFIATVIDATGKSAQKLYTLRAVGSPDQVEADPVIWTPDATAPATALNNDVPVILLPTAVVRGVVSAWPLRRGVDFAEGYPIVRAELFVTTIGGGVPNAVFQLNARYIDVGQRSSEAIEQSLSLQLPVVNVLDQRHELNFLLDRNLINPGTVISLGLTRQGTNPGDGYAGTLGLAVMSEFEYLGT